MCKIVVRWIIQQENVNKIVGLNDNGSGLSGVGGNPFLIQNITKNVIISLLPYSRDFLKNIIKVQPQVFFFFTQTLALTYPPLAKVINIIIFKLFPLQIHKTWTTSETFFSLGNYDNSKILPRSNTKYLQSTAI